jgi:hypothetical protein
LVWPNPDRPIDCPGVGHPQGVFVVLKMVCQTVALARKGKGKVSVKTGRQSDRQTHRQTDRETSR